MSRFVAMKREDSKPAAAPPAPPAPAAPPPKITRKISEKNVSDSCLEQFAKCEVRQFWNRYAPKPASSDSDLGAAMEAIGAAMGDYIPLHPMLQQEVYEEPEAEGPLFNQVVSDNALLQSKNVTRSVTCPLSGPCESYESMRYTIPVFLLLLAPSSESVKEDSRI